MSAFNPSKYKALIFDVYATLIDWETGIYEGLQPLLKQIDSPITRSKKDILTAYFSVEDDLQGRFPTMLYADILANAYAELEKRLKNKPSSVSEVSTGISSISTTTTVSGEGEGSTTSVGTSSSTENPSIANDSEAVVFGKSIPTWKPFEDTIPALASLSKTYKLTVLSNVDRASFSGTRKVLETSLPGHPFQFNAIYTAQDIGSYKPNPANFEYALAKLKETFGIEKDEVLVVAASLTHDHVPANALGIDSVFIDRKALSLNHGCDAHYNAKFDTLGAFAEEVRKQQG